MSRISNSRSRSRSPCSDSGESTLSWEEVNFAYSEAEVSDDDFLLVDARGDSSIRAEDERSSTSEESESPTTISSRDGSITPQTPTEVQYFDLTKPVFAPHPNTAARIVQAWWRTLRCPSIHLPDEEEEIIEELAPSSGEGVALRALGSAKQWDLWERQMEEEMPLIWENLDRRWLIYTMLLWLVLTISFQFHVPMAVANSSSAAQASKTPVVQSKSGLMNASKKLLLLPKYQIPNFASGFAYPALKGNWTVALKTQAALVIRVKTRFVATIAEADAESAWLSEARVRFALGAGKAVWSRSTREPSLWPWSFHSQRSAVAGLLPPPKPVKQGNDFKVWWWLLREKVAGEIVEACTKLPCSLTAPVQVPLLTWTPKRTTTLQLQLQPDLRDLRIVPKLPMLRPTTSLAIRVFCCDAVGNANSYPVALPVVYKSVQAMIRYNSMELSTPLPLEIYHAPEDMVEAYQNATQRKAEKERRADTAGAKRLQKGLRKAKKKADNILEKSRMQALHHLEKARKAFERKVEYARLAAGGMSCMD